MEKSKLGISIGLFGALLYFVGAVGGGIWVVAIAMGYILVFESSEWLKRTAIKALIITIFLSVSIVLIQYLFSFASYGFNALQNLNNIIKGENYGAYNVSNLVNFFQYSLTQILNIIQILIHIIFGFAAYKQKDIKIKVIDNILDKHFINN